MDSGARRVGVGKDEPDPLKYFLPEREGAFEPQASIRAETASGGSAINVQSEGLRSSSAPWMAGCSLRAASARERLSQRPRLGIVASFAIGAVVGLLVVQGFGSSRSPDRSDSSVRSGPRDIALPSSPGAVATTPVAQPVEVAPTAPPPRPSRALAPAAAVNYRGDLRIDSQPIGATVFVNAQRIGHTPIVLSSLPVGSRAVRLELEGHGTWSGSVRVVANQSARLSVRLESAR